MKKIVFGFYLLTVASFAFAHGGGKDAYGCHYDHKTGLYHCH